MRNVHHWLGKLILDIRDARFFEEQVF